LKSGAKALRLVRTVDGIVQRVTKSGKVKPIKTIKKAKKKGQGKIKKGKKGRGKILKQATKKLVKKAVEDEISCKREDLQQLGKVAKDGRAPREQRMRAVEKLDTASFACRGVSAELDNPDGKKITASKQRREFLAKSVGAELRKANTERQEELLAITDPQKLDAAWRARMLAEGVA
jgi:5'-deoxynucleotidase YfbR-like HD superfamily hydrolase